MIYYYPTNHFDYINCTTALYSDRNILESTYECGRKIAGMDAHKVIECASGEKGRGLLLGMGVYTKNIQKNLNWVPWIEIDGVHSDFIQKNAENDLIPFLCKYYLNC